MHYASPSPVPMYSADSPNIWPTGQFNTTRPNLFGFRDVDKITYFTPRFAGFQLGGSYVPDGTSETGSLGNGQYSAPNPKAGLDRSWSAAANYVNKFGAVDVAFSAGYQEGKVFGAAEDMSEYSFGTSIGVAGFTIGGGYKQVKDIAGISDNDSKVWSAGLKYGMGPWAVGVQYAKTTFDQLQTVGTGTLDDQDTWIIGGQYTLGPGITAFGGVQMDDNNLTASSSTRMAGETNTFFVGTALSF